MRLPWKVKSWLLGGVATVATIVLVLALVWKPRQHDPDALWKIVHNQCAVGTKPCAVYDSGDGYALLHSLEGKGQYLLIPTARVTGIESPEVVSPEAPNWFHEAWSERSRVSAAYRAPVPDRAMSLAINSRYGRSQNQLHIHLDCLNYAVRQSIDAQSASIGADWAPLPQPIMGHHYRAIRVPDLRLSPFEILGRSIHQRHHARAMGRHTLVVVWDQDGFIILDDVAHGFDRASGEELQDHSCRGFLPANSR